MTELDQIPASKFRAEDFLQSLNDDDLVQFVLNVGDADCQLLLLPKAPNAPREGIVVDVGVAGKLPPLVDALTASGDLDLFRVVLATHPHLDHIGGMAEFLRTFGPRVREYWDSGYRQPTSVYINVMGEIEKQLDIAFVQPTSGMTRYFGRLRVTVLAPSIGMRNRYDSYGVDPNNASVCLKLEYPVTRTVQKDDTRYLEQRQHDDDSVTRMILGADAQMESWGNVLADFPELMPDQSAVWRALKMKQGSAPLRAEILKVPHHCSKNGLTVELAAMVNARVAIVSSLGKDSEYGFPHALTQGALREAKDPIAQSGATTWPKKDYEMGIHYTGGTDSNDDALGSIAMVVKSSGRSASMWRFRDEVDEAIDLTKAVRYSPRG